MRIQANALYQIFTRVLLRNGFPETAAAVCAEVFVNNSIDGVYSHGVTRFPKYIRSLGSGHIKPANRSVLKSSFGSIEQWDGQSGPGPVNAIDATDRAVSLAQTSGIGCVALANTNHWLRGGTYAWRAAQAGCAFISWSNTIANMPAWGAKDARLGNNPLIIAVPFHNEAIVLDMAMSQYSYGAMEMYDLRNEMLPVPGGYDRNGNLTWNPSEIRASQRSLPIGYWKGSGLSLLLDILAVVLSGGKSVSEITAQGGEFNLSQVFLAIDLKHLQTPDAVRASLDHIINDLHLSATDGGKKARYPGEQIVTIREENKALGVPVIERVWDEIKSLDMY